MSESKSDKFYQRVAEQRLKVERLKVALSALDEISSLRRQRDSLLAVCKAIKQRIHFIGWPSEPMNTDGPDWSTEIALLEVALAK